MDKNTYHSMGIAAYQVITGRGERDVASIGGEGSALGIAIPRRAIGGNGHANGLACLPVVNVDVGHAVRIIAYQARLRDKCNVASVGREGGMLGLGIPLCAVA